MFKMKIEEEDYQKQQAWLEQRIEENKSSCAKPGTEITFEEMGTKEDQTLYRVRRGKRNFFTTSKELVEPKQ
jgi:hypothetical protein